MTTPRTDRRSFLKTGALAAAPVAALAPATVLAGDESAAKLARLEEERSIEALQRAFLRRFNGAPEADGEQFLARAGAVRIDASIASISEDPAQDGRVELAADGRTATYTCACRVEVVQDFEGDSTLERMARFQGQGRHRHAEQRLLTSELARTPEGNWAITRLTLA